MVDQVAALSEIYVPYGDPNWNPHWFDAGEFDGVRVASSMQRLNDVPENATLLPVIMFRPNGARTTPTSRCMSAMAASSAARW